MMRIITMSTLCADIFDGTGEIRPGGEALNFAAIACEYDHIQVGIMGAIGDDECGRYILKSIENKPIDQKSIHIIEGKNTASNRIYLTPEGNRYFKSDSWNGGVYQEFTCLSEGDIDQVKQADLVFINYYSPVFQHIIDLKQKMDFLLAVDFDIVRDYSMIEKYVPFIDFLFNSGDDGVLSHFQGFSEQYPCIFNVTLAEHGSVTYYKGEEYRVEAVPVKEVIDTTGCGDSYHAGFICSYSKDGDIITAMHEGSKIASRTLSHVGGFKHNNNKEYQMKKSIFVITVLLSVVFFSSCGTKIEGPTEETVINQDENKSIELEANQTSEETEKVTEQIEKPNILQNYGETAIQGDRIYYLEGFTLCGMNTNGRDHQELSSDKIRWFHVLEDQIYYVNWPDDIIYVMNTDGSQVKKLSDEMVGDIHIVNDKIYYSNPVDNDGIYSINMDGSNKTKWNDSSIGYFEMMDDRIYYFDSSSSNKGIYSEKIDGSDTFKLTDDIPSIIYLVDNWVYYLNEEDGNKLYAIQIDGSGKYKVTDDYALDISVAGDRIYYNDGRELKMYSINKDGSDRRRLLDHTVNWFIPGNDQLYYSISGFYIYSMNLDGSNQLVIKDLMSETFKDVSYEITKSLHENMPEYRFVAKGMKRNTEEEWDMGFVMGLEVYDDHGMVLVNADFSYPSDDWIMGNHVYNVMMDTMGLHVSDVNFDGYKDVIILDSFSGAHSNTWYQCWLWNPETSTFVESLSFKEICNPALDSAKKCIYSSGGSGAGNRGWDIYQFIEGEFVVTNRLTYNESADGFHFTEEQLVKEKMEILRDDFIQADNFSDAVSAAGYINDELWQLDHSRWYGVGGHEADQWLE